MIKKFTGIVVAVIILFGAFTLAACQTLDEYKAIKTSQLQEYADTKIEASSYDTEGLAAIGQAVVGGKNAIEGEQWSGSCCQDKGVLINGIKLQSATEYEMKHRHFDLHNQDEVLTSIPIGGFLEAIWEIETTHPEQFVAGVAPKGVYDIYLSNGEILRNAITIF